MSLKKFFVSWAWILAVLCITGVFYIAGLSRLPLEDADEATYAMVTREMMASGHYGTLTLFGKSWVDKPPLLFWSMAASARVFGFNEFALRLPAALFGVAAVLFTAGVIWELTRRKEAAFVGGLFLALMPLFLATARNIRMEVPVAAAVLAALFFFLKGREKPAYFLGVGISSAVGVLLKSVVGLFAFPVILLYAATYRDWRWLKSKFFWFGIAAGFAIAAPWHVYESLVLGPAFLGQYFGFQLGRVTENFIGSKITDGYVLWIFWKYGQPASFLFFTALALYFVLFLKKAAFASARKIFLFGTFSLASFVFVFGVFLAPVTKLVPYFTIAYPFLAMFLASMYDGAITLAGPVWRNALRIAMVLALAIALEFSFEEAFFASHLYVTDTSYDSKNIGITLMRIDRGGEIPVYLYEFPSDQTVQYYSGLRVRHITKESAASAKPPFFLVIPTAFIGQGSALDNFPQPYRGDYLTLVDLSAASAAE